MDKIKRLLNELRYKETDRIIEENEVSVLTINYIFTNDVNQKRIWISTRKEHVSKIDEKIIAIKIENSKNKSDLFVYTFEELELYFEQSKLRKKVEIHMQKEYIVFSKDMIKHALRDIRFAINDYIVARFRIIKIRIKR